MANILILDIETKPTLAYTFSVFDARITSDHIVENEGLLCVGAKWFGDKKPIFLSEWGDGLDKMLSETWQLIDQADAVVTYNGDKFDLPKLMGWFLQYGFEPPAPPTLIDLYKQVRKLGYPIKRLGHVGPLLGLGEKEKHEGIKLWIDTMNGCKKSQRLMESYCLKDVKLTSDLYDYILPYIRNHPHLGDRGQCGGCGSNNLQSRGYRRTKAFRIQRLQCQDCGSWSDGTRQKA